MVGVQSSNSIKNQKATMIYSQPLPEVERFPPNATVTAVKTQKNTWLTANQLLEARQAFANSELFQAYKEIKETVNPLKYLAVQARLQIFKFTADIFGQAHEIFKDKELKKLFLAVQMLEPCRDELQNALSKINDPKNLHKAIKRLIERNGLDKKDCFKGSPSQYSPDLLMAFLEERKIPKNWLSTKQIFADIKFQENLQGLQDEASLSKAISGFIQNNFPDFIVFINQQKVKLPIEEHFKEVEALYYSPELLEAFFEFRKIPQDWLTAHDIFNNCKNLRTRLAEIDIKTAETFSNKIKEFINENPSFIFGEKQYIVEYNIKEKGNQKHYSPELIEAYLQSQKPKNWFSPQEVVDNDKDYPKVKSKSPLNRAISAFIEANPNIFILDGKEYKLNDHFKKGKGRIPNFFSPLFMQAILKSYYSKSN